MKMNLVFKLLGLYIVDLELFLGGMLLVSSFTGWLTTANSIKAKPELEMELKSQCVSSNVESLAYIHTQFFDRPKPTAW